MSDITLLWHLVSLVFVSHCQCLKQPISITSLIKMDWTLIVIQTCSYYSNPAVRRQGDCYCQFINIHEELKFI